MIEFDFKIPNFQNKREEWAFFVDLHFYGTIFYEKKYIQTKRWNTKEAKKIRGILDFVLLKMMKASDKAEVKLHPYPKEFYTNILKRYVKSKIKGEKKE